MKQKFSNKWTGSKKPRKQRKYRANAPLHIRHNLMSSNLSKDLRKKYGKRSFPIRKDDSVKIMRGAFKGKKGKIDSVNLKKLRVMIAGIFKSKKDGSKVEVYFNPSNLQIQELNLEDTKRRKAIERKNIKETKENVKENKKEVKEKTEQTPKFKKLPESKEVKQQNDTPK
jgi:large subunit ribosomal protein L24